MEVSFLDLKEREIINVYDGRKLGRVIDVVFNNRNGTVMGIVVPGDKKIFRKAEDVFIPIEKIKRIGNDVILVGIQSEEVYRRDKYRDYEKNRSFENHNNYYSMENYYESVPRPRTPQKRVRQIERNVNPNIFYDEPKAKRESEKPKQKVSYVRLRPLKKSKYE